MSDGTVPFDEEEICDVCGAKGAYDFMGDLLCPQCAEELSEPEPCNRCGYDICRCYIDGD